MKEKNWKYLTIVLVIAGVLSLIFSSVTAFPAEMPIDSTYNIPTTYEVRNVDFVKAYIIVDFDPNKLDQLQDSLGVSYRIGTGNMGVSILQPVANNREPMTGFQVAIGRHGSPSSDLYMGIMYPFTVPCYNHPYDGQNYIIAGNVAAVAVPQPDTFYWFGIDCSDYPLDISSGSPPLGIVLFSTDDTTDGNYWMCGAGTGNPYSAYQPRGWSNIADQWLEGVLVEGHNHDMCFATYTTAGGGGDEVPSITISTTTWVTTSLGIFSLIGACLSGSKYFGWI